MDGPISKPLLTNCVYEAKFHELHQEMWLSDLIQHITSTMIQFYDVSDRSTSLKALQKLLDTIQLESRYNRLFSKKLLIKIARMTHVIRSCKLLMKLTLVCPYANISAYFIDKLRSDTVTAWTTLSSLPGIAHPTFSVFLPDDRFVLQIFGCAKFHNF